MNHRAHGEALAPNEPVTVNLVRSVNRLLRLECIEFLMPLH